MDLELTETQQLMCESVSKFLASEVPFDRVRALEHEQGVDRALWKALAEQGFVGLTLSEEVGGGGGTLVDLGLLVECLARRAVLVPVLEVAVCAPVLAASEPGRALLPELLGGDAIVTPAFLEKTDRFDRLEATVDADGRLHGEKLFVDYGQHASHHVVAARGAGGRGLYLVDMAQECIETTALRNIGRTPSCAVTYAGAAATYLADGDALDRCIAVARLLAAVQIVGSLAESLDRAVEYARVREQFGKAIGRFQAVRHHCANMASQISSSRQLVFEALSKLESGHLDAVAAAAAKASASRAAPEVLMLSHQIHGGNGVIEENDLYFFTLRGRERALAWGTVEECLDIMAAAVDAPVEWL